MLNPPGNPATDQSSPNSLPGALTPIKKRQGRATSRLSGSGRLIPINAMPAGGTRLLMHGQSGISLSSRSQKGTVPLRRRLQPAGQRLGEAQKALSIPPTGD